MVVTLVLLALNGGFARQIKQVLWKITEGGYLQARPLTIYEDGIMCKRSRTQPVAKHGIRRIMTAMYASGVGMGRFHLYSVPIVRRSFVLNSLKKLVTE